MRRRRLVATGWLALLVALCVALVWWLSRAAPVSAPESGPAAGAAQDPVADAAPTPPMVRVAAPLPPAAAMPPDDPLAAGPVGEQSAGTASVTGRCLAAEDRQPIADCVIVIRDTGVEVARSAADGTFGAEVALDARGGFTLRFDATGRATRIGAFTAMKEGSREDLGDLLLPRGWQVRGRVTEVDGAGVGGNNVLVFGIDTALRAGQSSQGLAGAVCAEDGAFTLDLLLPAGSYHAKVFGMRAQRGDGAFVVDPVRGAELLHLVVEPLQRLPSIRGTVVDARGQAIDGVGLRTEAGGASASSDRLGRFVLLADGPGTGLTRVLLQRPERWSPAFSPPVVEWGREDVRIVLPDGPRLAIEVVDDAGAEVSAYAVLLGPADQQFLPENRAGGRRREGGRCELTTPRWGEHLLRVVPDADDLECSELRQIDLRAEGLHHERFVLSRLSTAAVIVVDEAGGPVASAEVCLLRLGRDLERARHHERDPRQLVMHSLAAGVSDRIGRGNTEADGRTSLRFPRLTFGLGLRVRAAGFGTELITDPQLSVTDPLRVVLRRAGTLRVEVERNGEPRELFAVALWNAQGDPVHRIDGRIDAEDVCELKLPAGHYSVSVHRQVVVKLPGQETVRYGPCGAPVVGVEVLSGVTATVEVDVPRPSFGALNGRLSWPDPFTSVPPLLSVMLVRLDATDLRLGMFPVAFDGSFRVEGLLPGRYRVAVQNSGAGTMQSVAGLLDKVVEIEPGATRDIEFPYVRRRLQLRLRWPDGQPVQGPVEYRCGTLTAADRVAGELLLDPAPELPIELRAGDAVEWSTPVVMPTGRTEAVVDVVVPKPR